MRHLSQARGLVAIGILLFGTAVCQQRPRNDPASRSQSQLVPSQGAGVLYSIGGTVSNSVANSWVKLRSGDSVVKVTGSNKLTFPNTFLTGTHYAVTLDDNAPATGCAIYNGIDVLTTASVTNVSVICAAPTTAAGFNLSGFPGLILAGTGGNITVTATVTGGATSFDYRGVVKFTSSDPNAILPAPYQFAANDGGVHTFPAVLHTSGLQAIFVNDEQNGNGTSQSNINVGARAIFYLDVNSFPSSITAGQQSQAPPIASPSPRTMLTVTLPRATPGTSPSRPPTPLPA